MADRSVRVVLDAAVTGFVTGMGTAAQSAVGFARTAGGAIDKNRASMDQLAGTSFKVGVALTALAGFAVKSAMDWESAWTGVLKTVDGTPAQLAAVEEGLRGLATSMPESHQNIAAVAEAAGQLGVARDDVVAFTKTMVMLGDTTNLTAEEAATSMAQFMNIMGTAPSQVDNLGSALVELGNNGASTERQIIEMAQRIAGAGRIVGLTEANVLGIASAVASTGVEVEAGGTAISQTLMKMSQAVVTNSGELQVWAQTAGMSAQEFAQAWRDDPAAAFLAFEQGLSKQGQDAIATLDKLGLDGARVGRTLLNLAGANKLLAQSFLDSDQAMARNTALAEEAGKRYDTAAAQAEIAWNKIKDASIDAGQGLLPVVAEIAGGVGVLADAFGALPAPVQGSLAGLALIGGAGLLAFAGIAKLAVGVASTNAALTTLGVTAPRTAAALSLLTKGTLAFAAVAAALTVSDKMFGGGAPVTVEQYTRALLDLAHGGATAATSLEKLASTKAPSFMGLTITKDITSLGDAIDTLDASKWEKFLSSGIGQSNIEAAAESIGQIDSALVSLVESGAADEAAASFDYIAQQAEKQGVSLSRVKEMFPGYIDALAAMDSESRNAADGFREAAGGSDALAMRLAQLDADPAKAVEALSKLHKETKETARSFMGFTANLKESGQSFDQWARSVEDAARASADFQDNLIKLATRGLPTDWLSELEAMGPEAGGKLVEGLADASDKELARLVDLWEEAGGRINDTIHDIPQEIITQFDIKGADNAIGKAAKLAQQYDLTPEQVETILRANDWASKDIKAVLALMEKADRAKAESEVKAKDAASKVIKSILKLLGLVRDKSATITYRRRIIGPGPDTPKGTKWNSTRAMGGPVPAGYYAGGRVPGTPPADPAADNVVAFGATSGEPLFVRSREWIVNQKSSDENDNWIAAINGGLNLNKAFGGGPDRVLGFADGGAWDRAWRSATSTAQGTGRPAGSGGPQLMEVDLVDAQVEVDADGIARFVRGTVKVMLDDEREQAQRGLGQKIRGGR
jgi:TP901 family phage tail tape measure protein